MQRKEKAIELFQQQFNCCQSVFTVTTGLRWTHLDGFFGPTPLQGKRHPVAPT